LLTTTKVHVNKVRESRSDFKTTTEAAKLMHRFEEAQLEKMMDEAMLKPSQ